MDYLQYEDYLMHYGVKGMKWGVRRAQKKKTMTSSDKKNNKSEELNDNSKKKGLTDKQKTVLKVGAAAVGTALAVYGAYKVNNMIKDKAYQINRERAEVAVSKYMQKLNREKLPYIRDILDTGNTELANIFLEDLDRTNKKLSMDAVRYANNHSRTLKEAIRTVSGKNRAFTTAELLNMGIKTSIPE